MSTVAAAPSSLSQHPSTPSHSSPTSMAAQSKSHESMQQSNTPARRSKATPEKHSRQSPHAAVASPTDPTAAAASAVENLTLDNASNDDHPGALRSPTPSEEDDGASEDDGDSDSDDAPDPENEGEPDPELLLTPPKTAYPLVNGTVTPAASEHQPIIVDSEPNAPGDDKTTAPDAAGAKPKSKVKRNIRPPSPPPKPPPPRLTVRLNIKLGGPSDYEVNVTHLAKETGQRHPTPPPRPRGSDEEGDSSSEDEEKPAEEAVPQPIKRRRRRGYDLEDPFIDDSDLYIDAPTHFAQTKQQGFYVSSGDVALVKDKSPKKGAASGRASGVLAQAQAALGISGGGKPGSLGVELGRGGKPKGPSLTSLLANATAVAEAPAKVAPLTTIHGEVLKPSAATHPVSGNGAGTKDSPIALEDEEEAHAAAAAKAAALAAAQDPSAAEDSKPANGRFLPPVFVQHSNMELETANVNGHPSKRLKLDTSGASVNRVAEDTSMISMNEAAMTAAGTRKRKISKDVLEQRFHPDVTEALRGLQDAIEAANWTAKGKFPLQLKPQLQQVATTALRHGDYNDDFFDYLPTIFPYNRFTMMKLTSRLMYTEHQSFLQQRQEALLEELRQIAQEDFPKAQEDYSKACAIWDEKQKKKQLVATAGGVLHDGTGGEGQMDVDSRGPSPGGGTPAAAGTPAQDGDAPAAGGSKREEKAPVPRYKWTEPIKARVWGLVHLTNETYRLNQTMSQWDQQVQPLMEHSLKKALYAKIVSAFPEGWMNTGVISREISAMKAKLKKESEIASGVAGGGATGDMSS